MISSNAECAQHLFAPGLKAWCSQKLITATCSDSFNACCMQMPEHVAYNAEHAPCLLCSYSDVNRHACSGCHSECSPKVAFLFLDELTGHLHGIFEWELFMPADKEGVRSHLLLKMGFVPALGQSDASTGMCCGVSLAVCHVAVSPLHACLR